jgi:hypothetical protein
VPQKIGLVADGGTEMGGELTVDGHEVRVVIYGQDGGNATFTRSISPLEIGLPGGWQAQCGAAGSAT